MGSGGHEGSAGRSNKGAKPTMQVYKYFRAPMACSLMFTVLTHQQTAGLAVPFRSGVAVTPGCPG